MIVFEQFRQLDFNVYPSLEKFLKDYSHLGLLSEEKEMEKATYIYRNNEELYIVDTSNDETDVKYTSFEQVKNIRGIGLVDGHFAYNLDHFKERMNIKGQLTEDVYYGDGYVYYIYTVDD